MLQALQTQIDTLEQVLAEYCRGEPGYSLLRTVNGIGEVLATVILLETGSVERFADAGHYASYCRCVGSVYLSNGKKKGEGNSKNGNRYLAWAFVEAANFAVRTVSRRAASTRGRKPSATASWPSRRWRTSWRGPAITCSSSSSPSAWSAALCKKATAGEPVPGLDK